jgi:hypothetical protein
VNLRQLRLEEASFSQAMSKSEVAVTAYWNGVIGFARSLLYYGESFESEETFIASELYQELKSKAFNDLQSVLEYRFKTVAPLIQETKE